MTIASDGDRHIDTDPITATIAEFCKLSGIGRSKTYELLAAGDLESIHVGVRRLIVVASYRRFVARLQAAAGETSRRQLPMNGGRLVSAPERLTPEAKRTAAR
jgi:excisionase family DNA binding protein